MAISSASDKPMSRDLVAESLRIAQAQDGLDHRRERARGHAGMETDVVGGDDEPLQAGLRRPTAVGAAAVTATSGMRRCGRRISG